MPLSAQKQALRSEYMRCRRALTPERKRTLDRQIVSRVLQCDAYRNAQTIFCFVSMPHEIDTAPIFFDAWCSGKRTAAPRCRAHGEMDFFLIRSMQDLVPGAWDIPEPEGDCPLCLPDPKTLCIVPALAADARGNRLGHGGGYYDRYLAAHPVAALGICYSFCVSPALPGEPFDIPIDLWITDEPVKEV